MRYQLGNLVHFKEWRPCFFRRTAAYSQFATKNQRRNAVAIKPDDVGLVMARMPSHEAWADQALRAGSPGREAFDCYQVYWFSSKEIIVCYDQEISLAQA